MQLLLRSCVFDILFYSMTFVLGALSCPVFLLSRSFSVKLSRFWATSTLWLLRTVVRLTYHVEGLENIPETPFILASKHQSSWETLAFTSLLRDPAFILKHSLLFIPFVGWALWKLNMVAIRRGAKSQMSQMLNQIRPLLSRARPLVIFPEGTRTLPGQKGKYKKGLWVLYRQLNVPIVPVALNSGLFWARHTWLKKPGHIRVLIGKPLSPGLKNEEEFMTWIENSIENPSQKLVASA